MTICPADKEEEAPSDMLVCYVTVAASPGNTLTSCSSLNPVGLSVSLWGPSPHCAASVSPGAATACGAPLPLPSHTAHLLRDITDFCLKKNSLTFLTDLIYLPSRCSTMEIGRRGIFHQGFRKEAAFSRGSISFFLLEIRLHSTFEFLWETPALPASLVP